jgi:hypothetical protein
MLALACNPTLGSTSRPLPTDTLPPTTTPTRKATRTPINTERPFDEVLTAGQRLQAPHQNQVSRTHALRDLFEPQAFLFHRVS